MSVHSFTEQVHWSCLYNNLSEGEGKMLRITHALLVGIIVMESKQWVDTKYHNERDSMYFGGSIMA